MLVFCSGTIVMLGALVVFWAITRFPDMSYRDFRGVLPSLVARSWVTRAIGRNSPLRPSWTIGVVASPKIALALLDTEWRHAVRALVDDVATLARPLRERLARAPSPFASRALAALDEVLAEERERCGDAGVEHCANARVRLDALRRHVVRMGDAVFELDARLRTVRNLLEVRRAGMDQNTASALGELEDRVDALAVTEVRFAHPETIAAVERELERIQQFLLRWDAEATAVGVGSSDSSDPWMVLGVARDATAEDIRAAYRSKIAQCHPDRIESRIANLTSDAEMQQLLRRWFTDRAQRLNDAYRTIIMDGSGGVHGNTKAG